MLREPILTMAQSLSNAQNEELPVLESLCRSAEAFWKSRLRGPLDKCPETFTCAAAFYAAAALADIRNGGDVASFSAGDLSVNLRDAGPGDGLRRAAEALMAPFALPENVWLRGVRG